MGATATLVQTSGAISVFAASEHIKKGRRACCLVQWWRSEPSETLAEAAGGGGGGTGSDRIKRRATHRSWNGA